MKNEKLHKEAFSRFNQLVLIGWEVCRLIGYAEDETDCYWIIRRSGGTIMWCTCVGGYIWLQSLKGQELMGDWDDYKRLDSLLQLNGCDWEDKFHLVLENKKG